MSDVPLIWAALAHTRHAHTHVLAGVRKPAHTIYNVACLPFGRQDGAVQNNLGTHMPIGPVLLLHVAAISFHSKEIKTYQTILFKAHQYFLCVPGEAKPGMSAYSSSVSTMQ